jgi:hypothetical protein
MDDYRDLVEERLDRIERLLESESADSRSSKRSSRRG